VKKTGGRRRPSLDIRPRRIGSSRGSCLVGERGKLPMSHFRPASACVGDATKHPSALFVVDSPPKNAACLSGAGYAMPRSASCEKLGTLFEIVYCPRTAIPVALGEIAEHPRRESLDRRVIAARRWPGLVHLDPGPGGAGPVLRSQRIVVGIFQPQRAPASRRGRLERPDRSRAAV